MALRITGSVIGEPITSSSSSATGMWLSQEVAALQQDGIWQIAPGFTLTSSAATVNEGASITITLTTTGIPNGYAVPYVISGANIFANDSANGVITGNFVIQNNSNTISFAANADLLTEDSEAFTITAGGASTSVTINDTSLTPVAADAQFPYTTLALHGNGTNNAQNNTFLDSSTNNFSITRNGNSTQGTFSPYGGNWSNYFDGTGDVLVGPTSNTVFQLTNNGGTGLTVEAWIYPISTSGSKQIVTYYAYTDGSAEQGWYFRVLDGQLQCGNAFGGTSRSGGSIPVNTWTHVAFVINSGSFYLYVNGVSVGTVAGIGSQDYSGTTLVIGGLKQNGTNTNQVFNGYISNLRITNTAAYTGAFTPSTSPLTAIAGTSLLTCQDNRLIDESPNNFTITKTGDVSVQKFNPFSPVITTPTTYSNYFTGDDNSLSIPSNAAFNLGTNNFTIEFWYYPTSFQSYSAIVAQNNNTNSASNWNVLVKSDGAVLFEAYIGASFISVTTSALSLSTWSHVACVRSGSTFTVYVNGTASGTPASEAGALNSNALAVRIGRTENTGTSRGIFGYVSNLRIVNGTAVYTSTFAPPTTPLTAIANTSLLTCQSPTFIDNSTNTFAITAFGNSKPTTVNPFGFTNTSSEYSTTTFSGSAYFDGTNDYLILPSNAAFGFGTGDFTMECWIFPTSTKADMRLWEFGGNADNVDISITSTGTINYYNGSTSALSSAGVISFNSWSHIALVRSSGTVTVYVNGTSRVTQATTPNSGARAFYLGGVTSTHFEGYISNMRIVKGTAVYTGAFTPPVAPITAVANTQLLCNFTNAGIIDNAMMTNLETIADAKISTTQSKFGGTSMSFDGTGDYLSTYNPSYSLSVGSGDFTYECWLYVNSLPGTVTAVYHLKNDAALATTVFILELTPAGAVSLSTGTALIAAGTTGKITTGSWIHFAFVRTSGVFKTFFNGIQDISVANTTAYNGTYLHIGAWRYSSYDYSLNGYLDDVRITKGYARYTSNFTPPTEFDNK